MSRRPAPEMIDTPNAPPASAAVPVTSQIQFAERDLAMRRAAYPAMTEKGQITVEQAAADLTVLSCIVASLRVFQLQAKSKGKRPKNAPDIPANAKPVVVYFETEAARQEFVAMLAGLGVKDIQTP